MLSSVAEPAEVIDLRCPAPDAPPGCSAGVLLARLQMSGDQPTFVQPNNLIEMACDNCKRHHRRRDATVIRVLHRYDFGGNLVETLVVRGR